MPDRELSEAKMEEEQKVEITIGQAAPEDAEDIIEYLKIVGGETDNLSFGPEGMPISIEDEKKFIESFAGSHTSVMLAAKKAGKIVGIARFELYSKERMKHRGAFGISIIKAEWGHGLGSLLLEGILDFAKNKAHAEIISLEVRSDNARAIHLYQKYGFEKIGDFKGFFKINGSFIDFTLMNLYL